MRFVGQEINKDSNWKLKNLTIPPTSFLEYSTLKNPIKISVENFLLGPKKSVILKWPEKRY